jgi:carboxyl-terminal processing protease
MALVAGAAFVAAAQDEARTQETAQVLDRVVTELRTHGVELDADKARTAAIEAIIRTADAQGTIMTTADIEQWSNQQEGLTYCTGLRLTMTNGQPLVTGLAEGSPAEAAGLEAGDLITAIDDTTLAGTDIVFTQGMLCDSEERSVQVTVQKTDGTTNTVAVALAMLQLPGIETAELLPSGLCYIRINGFYAGVGDAVLEQFDAWRSGEHFGLILDLRSANGGDVDSAARISSLFAEANMMLFAFRDTSDQDLAVSKAADTEPLGMPTMVLIDGQTCGAAEVLAASMKRSIRGAMLLGTESRGDPSIREFIDFSPDEKIYVATRRLVTADGTVYSGQAGIVPDVTVAPRASRPVEYEPMPELGEREQLEEEIEDTLLAQRVKGDAVLRRAVDILLGLKALNIRGFRNANAS